MGGLTFGLRMMMNFQPRRAAWRVCVFTLLHLPSHTKETEHKDKGAHDRQGLLPPPLWSAL